MKKQELQESANYYSYQTVMLTWALREAIAGNVEWIARHEVSEQEWYRYAVINPCSANGGVLLREFNYDGQTPSYTVEPLEHEDARIRSGRGMYWETEPIGKCVAWAHIKQDAATLRYAAQAS